MCHLCCLCFSFGGSLADVVVVWILVICVIYCYFWRRLFSLVFIRIWLDDLLCVLFLVIGNVSFMLSFRLYANLMSISCPFSVFSLVFCHGQLFHCTSLVFCIGSWSCEFGCFLCFELCFLSCFWVFQMMSDNAREIVFTVRFVCVFSFLKWCFVLVLFDCYLFLCFVMNEMLSDLVFECFVIYLFLVYFRVTTVCASVYLCLNEYGFSIIVSLVLLVSAYGQYTTPGDSFFV